MTIDGENLEGAANVSPAKKRPLTRADLITRVAEAIAVSDREAKEIVERIFDSIVRALNHSDRVEIRGFGSFRLRQRAARMAHNPKTGAPVDVPAKKLPYFKPGKELLAAVQPVGIPLKGMS